MTYEKPFSNLLFGTIFIALNVIIKRDVIIDE